LNKRHILNRIDEKVSDAHDAMDTGLSEEKYNREVGEISALKDLRDFVVEISDDDDVDDDELGELPT
jgi:hypothetical protein